jgi:hypothetical protein
MSTMDVSSPAPCSGAATPESAPLCFVHIPKTAGATLKDLLTRAYPTCANVGNWLNDPARAEQKLAERAKSPALVLAAGHMPYGAYRSHMPESARYITLLREPVDRVLSHYFRHMQGKKLDGKNQLSSISHALDLDLPQLSNLSTRFLCDDPSGELSADSLAQAKRNLRGFAFVGVQERFDESMVLLQQVLGLEDVAYGVSRHVNAYRPSIDEISDADRRMILARNALDAELYDHGRALFEEFAGAAEDGMAAKVARLHELRAALVADHAEKRLAAASWLAHALPPGSTRLSPGLKAEGVAAGLDLAAMREEIAAMRGQGRAVLLALDDERRFLSTDSRFLARRVNRVLYLTPDESRAIRAELDPYAD